MHAFVISLIIECLHIHFLFFPVKISIIFIGPEKKLKYTNKKNNHLYNIVVDNLGFIFVTRDSIWCSFTHPLLQNLRNITLDLRHASSFLVFPFVFYIIMGNYIFLLFSSSNCYSFAWKPILVSIILCLRLSFSFDQNTSKIFSILGSSFSVLSYSDIVLM